MASKGTKITDRERKLIIADYILGESMHVLSKKHKRSVSTIKRVIDDKKIEQPNEYSNAVEQLKKDNTNEILNSIADNKTFRIIDKYKDVLLKDDNIKGALTGAVKLQVFITGVGVLYDKILKLKAIQDGVNSIDNLIMPVKVVNDARTNNKDK